MEKKIPLQKGRQLFVLVFVLLFTRQTRSQTLEQFIEKAALHDPQLKIQTSKTEEVAAIKTQAWSPFMPKASLNYNWQNNETTADPRTFSLQVSQNIFRGFSDYFNLLQQNHLLEAETEKLKLQELVTTQKVGLSVIEFTFAQEQKKILNEYYNTLTQRDRELKRRGQIGKSRNVDIVQNQIRMLEIQRLLFENTQHSNKAVLQISELTGVQNPAPQETLGSLIQKVRSRLKSEDHLIKSQQLSTQAAEYAYKASRGTYFPAINLVANYYPVTNESWTRSNDKWSLGIQLQWFFFEGGFGRASVQKSFAILNQTRNQEIRLYNEKIRYESEWKAKIIELEKQHELAVQALELSRKALIDQNKDFRLGLITILDLTTTDQQNLDLKLENLRIEYSLATEYANALTKGVSAGEAL